MKSLPLLYGALLVACAPTFDEDVAHITEPRILAVKSEPAEAKPGTPLSLTAFVATPDVAEPGLAPSWSLCTAPKPPTENNVVSAECLNGGALSPVGQGLAIQAQAPFNACALFGPDTPPGGFRPRDPDVTGGYYQPVRVDLAQAAPVFHLERITCDLGQAPFEIAEEFGMSYLPNQNPHLAPLTVSFGGESLALDQIPSGASVELEASWPAEDAESYSYFDRAAQTLTTKREAMRVVWYVSAGQLDTESSGRAEGDLALSVSNRWLAPSNLGAAKLWVVLRDSRGGVDFAAYDLSVVR